jgi:hypothetical protein
MAEGRMGADEIRRQYLRPLYLALGITFMGEAVLFALYGVVLFPQGPILTKLAWAVACALGMGAVAGVCVTLLVVGRLDGTQAMWASTLIWALSLGVGCNALCFSLGRQFGMWGADTHPEAFLAGGFLPSVLGGIVYSYALFTQRGRALLARIGL